MKVQIIAHLITPLERFVLFTCYPCITCNDAYNRTHTNKKKRASVMKVQISMTVELDAKDLKSYMSDLGCENETVAEYVRSYAISAIPAMLSEHLRDNGYQSDVTVTKSNY